MLVCVGIPAIDGKVCAQTVDSLLSEQVLSQGVHFLVMWELGCSLIGHARNRLAKRFLEIPQAEALIFIDSDISWKGGELARLASRPEEVIGGTYRGKFEGSGFHLFGKPKKAGGLYTVDGLPGGFLKISRSAFGKIAAKRYIDTNNSETSDYFPTGFHRGRLYGEDYGFCRLWRQSGGTVWLDPSFTLRHHDGGTAYSGDVATWIEGA